MIIPILRSMLPVSAPSEDDCARGIRACERQRIATSFGDGTSGERVLHPAGETEDSADVIRNPVCDGLLHLVAREVSSEIQNSKFRIQN